MPDIDPPLVDLKVNNPVTYLKKWWAKIIGNEGIDFRLHFHPLTAIAMSLAIASVGFGVGRFVFPFSVPFFKYVEDPVGEEVLLPSETIAAANDVLNDTAFVGTLHFSNTTQKYYLVTTSSQAITLKVPTDINLEPLIGKRILAVGQYNKTQRLLEVDDAKDMEILPKKPSPIPTAIPTPTPTPTDTTPPESSP